MSPLVSIRNLQKTYQRGPEKVEVLHGIDLDVHAGETVTLLGRNGGDAAGEFDIARGHAAGHVGAAVGIRVGRGGGLRITRRGRRLRMGCRRRSPSRSGSMRAQRGRRNA